MIVFRKILYFVLTVSIFSSINLNARIKREPVFPLRSNDVKKIEDFGKKSWEEICKQAQGAVCQIISYAAVPNPFEPFKSPSFEEGKGSGFCISSDGFIVTNFHVVRLASIIKMRHALLGDDKFDLEYIGGCPDRDIALLRLTAPSLVLLKEKLFKKLSVNDLPFLSFGDSDQLSEAQEIATVGFPLGQENWKSSLGNVSGWQKIPDLGGECIQTTIPVNPGNSGGAVLNRAGLVIGICVGAVQGADGIGYLIPINDFSRLKESLFNDPIVRTPYWGVEIKETTQALLSFLEAPISGGVFISKVNPGSVGEQMGLMSGDILFECSGITVDAHGQIDHPCCTRKIDLESFFRLTPFGEVFDVVVFRDGQQHELSYRVAPRKKVAIDAVYPWVEPLPDYEIIGGLVVCQLTSNHLDLMESVSLRLKRSEFSDSAVAKYKKLENRLEPRLFIGSVFPGSQAYEAHCFESLSDHLIESVNECPVRTIEDFRNAVLESRGKPFLTIRTEGGALGVLSVEKIVEQESALASRHYYKISKLIDELR